MLTRIRELMIMQKDFSFETTLSARHFTKVIKDAQKQDYSVTLVFFWLNSVELAIERVKRRVSEGGHNIPIETIRKRYELGMKNLIKLYIPICDYWIIVNNSHNPFNIIAEGQKKDVDISDNAIWTKLNNMTHE